MYGESIMKICFVYFSLGRGGAERTIVNLSNYLQADYNDEISIVLISESDCYYKIASNVKIYALNEKRVSTSLLDTTTHTIAIIKKLRTILNGICPDIIVAFSSRWFLTCKAATIGKGIRIVGSERSNPKTVMTTRLNRILIYLSSLLCDGYIFPTRGAKECYPKTIQNKAVVIPNGVDCPKEGYENKKSSGFKSICSAGRLIKGKRYDVLLKAFSIVQKHMQDIKLTIYGEGKLKEELKKLAQELNIADKVFFCGFKEDFYHELQKHDLFVYCSESESWGNVLSEAMSCGLPCISTDYEFGARDMIVDGKNGLLVPVGNVEILAEAILKLAANEEWRLRLSMEARASMEQLDYTTIAKKYRDYFKEVIGVK